MGQKICTNGIYNNNVYKGFDPIFKKDIVNMTSKCLKHERGKNMQMLLNHMKANLFFNGCKDIINGVMYPNVFIIM
jgi:hypothetical protein